jgi:type I restriction enzyme S subunit
LCSAEFIVLPENDRIDGGYLQYFLNSTAFVKFATHLNTGDRPRIDFEQIAPYEIPLPSLERQRRVVAEIEKQFSRLDEAVANLRRVKASLRRYRNSVLQTVTSGSLATEDGESPRVEDWRWLTIAELASAEPRSIQSGPFGSNLLHSEFQATGKLVIGIDNVRDGEFSIGSNHRISEAKFQELAKYAARPGDVLITVMATIGRVCVLPADIEPAIITKHVYRITVDASVVLPAYVGIALRGSREVREQLMASVQGQTRPGLNGGLIKKIRVPVPPLAHQHRIVAEVDRRLSIVRGVEAEVDANLKRAQSLRQAVLAKAFSPSRSAHAPA